MWAGDSTIPRLIATAGRVLAGRPSELQLRSGPSPTEVLRSSQN